ncbi:hypothetical protein [Oceanicella actignis]|uniref:hypothetical protein n=1 Tax=Oceanicella actignis TaxID=1189325 RepID=UPI00125B2351|nr:hypothetical protein [Oceanicella actignis]TYO91433.1 hypothetical protein LY05_00286 [Oceanicella actignis]
MQVKLLEAIQNGTQVINAGCVIDLPEAEAKALIREGRASAVAQDDAKASAGKAKPGAK